MPNEQNPVAPELTAALQKAAATRPDREREQRLAEDLERLTRSQLGDLVRANQILDTRVRHQQQWIAELQGNGKPHYEIDDDLKRWMFGNLPEGHVNTLKLHEILDAKETT
jgi:hypothetical protein